MNVVGDSMSPLNLQVMVNANGTPGDRLKTSLDAIRASRYKDRMVMFVGLDLRDVGPGSGQKIAAQLEADVKAGALGVGEIMKNFGLFDQEGRRHAAEARRSGAGSGLGEGRAT